MSSTRGLDTPAANSDLISAGPSTRRAAPAKPDALAAHLGFARELALGHTWNVLAIEDDADDVFLIANTLREAPGGLTGGFDLVSRDTVAAGLEHLRTSQVDVVLLDLTLPDSVGLEGLAQIRAQWPELPIVVLTGRDDETLALRALREGAQDYILKSQAFSTLLARLLRHAIERKHVERETVASEERYRQLLETASEGVWTFDVAGAIDYANPRTLEMLGVGMPELIGRRMEEFVVPLQRSALIELLARCTSGERIAREFDFQRSDGSGLCAKISCNPLRDADQKVVGMLALFTDLTERREAERVLRERDEERREAHKLEAVGRLAGGIAHDFNNMLTVIGSYTEMVLSTHGLDPAIAADLGEVAAAADRAARLTRQLLAFSRKQLAEYQPIDLPGLVSGIGGLLQPLAGGSITLRFDISEKVPPILADPRQLEQVLVNLVCNARDAMPTGGAIEVVVSRRAVSAEDATAKLPAGDFVVLEVTDTGSGMEPGIVARIFEPFFTTKAEGSGTGLGLASAHGIMLQAGGHIWCESEVGRGSSFFLAFPTEFELPAAKHGARATARAAAGGSERILLVEDEASVRTVTARVLIANGYNVLSAGNAVEALDTLNEVQGAVDLVITDLVMPKMNGPEFAAAALLAFPRLRIVYMSGYSTEDTWKQALSHQYSAFLEKPFTSEQLLSTVRAALEGASEGA